VPYHVHGMLGIRGERYDVAIGPTVHIFALDLEAAKRGRALR